jgi:hypothetical protein
MGGGIKRQHGPLPRARRHERLTLLVDPNGLGNGLVGIAATDAYLEAEDTILALQMLDLGFDFADARAPARYRLLSLSQFLRHPVAPCDRLAQGLPRRLFLVARITLRLGVASPCCLCRVHLTHHAMRAVCCGVCAIMALVLSILRRVLDRMYKVGVTLGYRLARVGYVCPDGTAIK